MNQNDEAMKYHLSLFMKETSGKWYMSRDLVNYLRTLGFELSSRKTGKLLLAMMESQGCVERIRKKKQWTLYAWRYVHEYAPRGGIGPQLIPPAQQE